MTKVFLFFCYFFLKPEINCAQFLEKSQPPNPKNRFNLFKNNLIEKDTNDAIEVKQKKLFLSVLQIFSHKNKTRTTTVGKKMNQKT